MLASLFPRAGNEFYDFFERHAGKTLEAARLLRDMLAAPKDAEREAAQIKSIEHEGDEITHRTMEMLHQTFDSLSILHADIGNMPLGLADIVKDGRDAAQFQFLNQVWCHLRHDHGQPGHPAPDHQPDAAHELLR